MSKKNLLTIIGAMLILLSGGCGEEEDNPFVPLVDTTRPEIVSTIPLTAETGVPVNGNIEIFFNEPMDPQSLFSYFSITPQAEGILSYGSNTLTFVLTSNLEPFKTYSVTIKKGAKDLSGNSLLNDYTWSFTTGSPIGADSPYIVSVFPEDESKNIPLTTNISIVFSKPMDTTSVKNNFFLIPPKTGSFSWMSNEQTMLFQPANELFSDTTYAVNLKREAKDQVGNPLQEGRIWSFATPDTIAPRVLSTSPAEGATNVAADTDIKATFSEDMDPATLSSTTFTAVDSSDVTHTGVITYDSGTYTVILNPDTDFTSGETITVTITIGAKDLADNPLESDKTWTFTIL
jgi:hypothetical protein